MICLLGHGFVYVGVTCYSALTFGRKETKGTTKRPLPSERRWRGQGDEQTKWPNHWFIVSMRLSFEIGMNPFWYVGVEVMD